MLRVLLTIGIGGPILGGLFAWQGLKERDVAKESSATPETMSLSKLIARGPNGNANVIVTDFVLVRDHAVERGRKGRVSGTWVPLVPKDADPAGGSPRALKVLVYCDGSSGPDGVFQRVSTPQIGGLVINKIKTPSSSVKDHFEKAYPQTDFSNCIYIQEGREPTSETTASLLTFGGIAAIVIGLGALVLALIVWQKNRAGEARPSQGRKKRRPVDDEDDEDDRPRKRRSAARDDEDEERPRRRRAADDDEDEAPRKKRRPADDEDDERPSRRRVSKDEDADGPPRRRRPVDDDEDDRPRRRPRRDD